MQMSRLTHRFRSFRRHWPPLFLVFISLVVLKLVEMDAIVREKFEGKQVPSVIYARPLPLVAGAPLRAEDLKQELKALGYSPVSRLKLPGQYTVEGGVYTIFRRAFVFPDAQESSLRIRLHMAQDRIEKIELDGQIASQTRLDPLKIGGIYAGQKVDRQWIKLNQVPPYVIDALLAIEDRGFYNHHGFSPRGITRAIVKNLRAGHVVEGGSTITQQLAKNTYLTDERSFKRKGLELVYSLLTEIRYSKEEILERYINEVYLGQSGDYAIHGFGLASEFYFGRPIENINLPQAALLAAMVKGPSLYHPFRYTERSLQRRNQVLKILYAQKKISKRSYQTAVRSKAQTVVTQHWASHRFPAYLDLVHRHLQRDYGKRDLSREGLRIFTAFDPIVQWHSEAAVSDFVKGQGKAADKLQIAALVVSEGGEIEAIIGDKVPRYPGFNRALDAKRSIGSLAKPIVLLAALSQPQPYSLQSLVADDPVRVMIGPAQFWEPKNFDFESHGQVSLLTMLSQSYNQATVRLGMHVGMDRVRDTFKRLSGRQEIPNVPSIMLGSMSMSPLEVAGMYHTIFSGGHRQDLSSIRAVQTFEGLHLKKPSSKVVRAFDSMAILNVQDAMRAVVSEGTGRSALAHMPAHLHGAAGKTGTSDQQRDSWFAGFTGDKLAITWVGNDQYLPTELARNHSGLTVWAKIMAGVSHKSLPTIPSPRPTLAQNEGR